MKQHASKPLGGIHEKLIKLTQAWSLRQPFDAEHARALRRQAILLNTKHYVDTIPAYQARRQPPPPGQRPPAHLRQRQWCALATYR